MLIWKRKFAIWNRPRRTNAYLKFIQTPDRERTGHHWNEQDRVMKCVWLQQTQQQEPHRSSQQKITMPSITILYTTGIHQELYSFVDLADKNRWESDVVAIKSDGAAAFNKKEAGGASYQRTARFVQELEGPYSCFQGDIFWVQDSPGHQVGPQQRWRGSWNGVYPVGKSSKPRWIETSKTCCNS